MARGYARLLELGPSGSTTLVGPHALLNVTPTPRVPEDDSALRVANYLGHELGTAVSLSLCVLAQQTIRVRQPSLRVASRARKCLHSSSPDGPPSRVAPCVPLQAEKEAEERRLKAGRAEALAGMRTLLQVTGGGRGSGPG